MRYIVGLALSMLVLALAWAASHYITADAQRWVATGAELSTIQRVLYSAASWFVRLFPLLVILLPVLGVLMAGITRPRTSRTHPKPS